MGMQEVMSWYQKKIGTYDKQQWEHTIEQRIIHGLTHVPKKTAKLKTDLIDVDLVRGSSFPKAKPKHGLITVTRLACLRLVLLPAYSHWWIQQTSPRVFVLLTTLYVLQLVCGVTYFYYCSLTEDGTLERVTASEVMVPVAMMIILSVIHSQIVSTHIGPCRQPSSQRPRRSKRTRRRHASSSRSRASHGSEKTEDIDDQTLSSYQKRPLIRRFSSDDVKRSTVMWDISCKQKKKPDLLGKPKSVGDSNSPSERQQHRNRQGHTDREAQNHCKVTPLDDDGFESLTGNGSSENGEEAVEEGDDVEENKQRPSLNKKGENSFASSLSNSDSKTELSQQSALSCVSSEKNSPDSICDITPETLPGQSYCHLSDTPEAAVPTCTEDLRKEKQFRNSWSPEIITCHSYVPDGNHADNETDGSDTEIRTPVQRVAKVRSGAESSYNSSCDSEGQATEGGSCCPLLTEITTSAGEWMGVTTNSEECSYSSELDETDSQHGSTELNDHPFAWEIGLSPNVILSPSCATSDKVSCTIWENHDVKKADLSVLDISSAIIARVETMPENMDYFYAGVVVSVVISLLPSICRFVDVLSETQPTTPINTVMLANASSSSTLNIGGLLSHFSDSLIYISEAAVGGTLCERILIWIAVFERFVLSVLFFFLLAVAERTFKQRFLYAKLFSHLTSFRRAKKSELPHFRLNKVRNIKTWLSVRSYLKKRGPQRSVDMIVSAAFLITLLLLSFLSVEFLKVSVDENTCDSEDSSKLHSQYNLEALIWCLVLGVFLLRFMTLGTKTNRKYRNLSVLLTEQINLYLQIEQKPHKKEELMVANSVLKLAADLLKELESPFKISGLSANPYLYTITKVVILSALSGVLSEMLGFKLKLHKIKIK
ncbi:protein PHTF1 isoform X1 [Schistocerca piceifrons]|uniref:protein PHTF1 isoform X1 n=2 Tax=Schistocerca piceifrons TaxID=274613 RepID=UPI001F5FCFE7|nr:protein PHTF1 isoform X1 [Schistocerca piceifrons]